MTDICNRLRSELGELFRCSQAHGRVRVGTPIALPDGTLVDVFLTQAADGGFLATDLGETMRWIESHNIAPPGAARVEAALAAHRARNLHGEFLADQLPAQTGASLVIRTAQACAEVGSLAFASVRKPAKLTADFAREVVDLVESRSIPVKRGASERGLSITWTVGMRAGPIDRLSLVHWIGGGGRRQLHLFKTSTMWHDLRHLRAPDRATGFREFFTVIDDREIGWDDEQLQVLSGCSRVVRWSQRDDFVGALVSA